MGKQPTPGKNNGKGKTSPEIAKGSPALPEQAGEIPDELKARREALKKAAESRAEIIKTDQKQQREGIKAGKQVERSDEALKLQDEKSQASLIGHLEFNKSLEQQPKGVREAFLFSLEYEVLPQLFNAGIDTETVLHFSSAANGSSLLSQKINEARAKNPALFINWDLTTQTTFETIMKAAEGNELGKSLFAPNRWTALVNKASEKYTQAKALRDTPLALWKNTKEIGEKSWKYITTHKKETALVVLGLVGAGWLIKRLFGHKKNDNEDHESNERGSKFSGKIVKGGIIAAGAIGALYVLSKILPGGDAARKWLTDIFGIDEAKKLVVEEVKKGIEWLDKELGFSAAKEKFMNFIKEHRPNWITEGNFAWLKNMSLAQIAKDMGLDPESDHTWREYAVEGGAALLIYKWAGMKGLLLNAIPYLFFIREGKNSFGGKILASFAREFDDHKKKILDGVRDIPGAGDFLADALEGVKLEDRINVFLEFLKDHKLESMAAFNGLWMCRAIVFGAIKALIKTGGKVALYAVNNPLKTAMITGALGFAYLNRRRLVEQLVNLVYENPKSDEAKDMLQYLSAKLDIDRSKPETLAERQMPAFAESILEDGARALTLPHVREAWGQGRWALAWGAGKDALLFVKGVSAPYQMSKLSWETFNTVADTYSPEHKGNALAATMIGGIEMVVICSTAWEGLKAYHTIYTASNRAIATTAWRTLRSAVPMTNEWKFVMRSMLSGTPGVIQLFKAQEQIGIRRVMGQLGTISDLAKQSTPNLKKIQDLALKILNEDPLFAEEFKEINRKLVGTHFGYTRAKVLEKIRLSIDKIREMAAASDAKEVEKYIKMATDGLDDATKQTETIFQKGAKAVSKFFAPISGATRAQNVLRYTGRALGVTAILYTGYKAGEAFYEAAGKDEKEQRNLLLARSATYTAETGATVGMIVGGAALGVAGGITIGLGTGALASMAHNAIDSAYETTKTPAEWAKEVSYAQLVHEWLSSSAYGGYGGGEYMTAGDAYRFKGGESRRKEHDETRKKIIAALFMQEDGTGEADKDRMYFIEKMCGFRPPMQYRECLNLLTDSKLYAGIQHGRRKAKAEGQENYYIAGVDVLNDRFEKPERDAIVTMVQVAKKDSMSEFNPSLQNTFSAFSDAYLLDILEQAFYGKDSLKASQKDFALQLQAYLVFQRNMNPDLELRKRLAERKGETLNVDHDALAARIERLQSAKEQGVRTCLDEYKKQITDTAPCYALYNLAHFFGYTGYQNEKELQKFFTEDRKDYFGIYWNGDEWVVNEQGSESDNEIGPELNAMTIQAVIKELRGDPGNILEHRHDSLFYSEGETLYSEQVLQMAHILENGLNKYEKYGRPRMPEKLPENPGARKMAA